MQVGPVLIRELFEHTIHYEVPLFQRPYVWSQAAQWQPLWQDIERLAEALTENKQVRAHFLGAAVLERRLRPHGQIETKLVIDGQQRLTTLQLLLEAFADIVTTEGDKPYANALRKLTRNDHPLSTEPRERYKIWPTNIDRDLFRHLMEATGPTQARAFLNQDRSIRQPLVECYLYFHETISAWLRPGSSEFQNRIAALYATLRENVRLIVIDLDDRDDTQLIFETLNARGTPLLPSDLIKNLLFQRAQKEGAHISDLYARTWKAFDDESDWWRKSVGKGHAQRPRIDTFLQHYLVLKTGNEVPTAHLYATYSDYAATKGAGDGESQLQALKHYAALYRKFGTDTVLPRARLFFERLEAMDVTTAYPLLLDLYAQHAAQPGLIVDAIQDLEAFLVRRMICRLSTRGYNKLFVELTAALADKTSTPRQVLRIALLHRTAETDRWPDDDEFMAAWTGQPLYKMLTRARMRMLLTALERGLRTEKSETDEPPRKLHIEHVMPQAWEQNWPPPPGVDINEARVRRGGLVHSIGNLTLLSAPLNESISNGPWLLKCGELKKHSVFHLNKKIAESQNWSDEMIVARSRALLDVALILWPRPGARTASDLPITAAAAS